MATIIASIPTSTLTRPSLLPAGGFSGSSSAVLGLPPIVSVKRGRVRCSAERKPAGGGVASVAAAAVAMCGPAVALVDERMSTEGTGLPIGLSNNTLGWIIAGMFALIWALYFTYTATLEEDEESGLSL